MVAAIPRVPKVVKIYGDLGPAIERAVSAYAEEVENRSVPVPDTVDR
jgi:3-methyl-2-oxobutanoate hydroxymethyltransferase